MYILYNSALRNTDREVEGVGSIYFKIINLIAFCRHHNLEFIHYKHHIGHNYNNMDENEWDTKWDNLFNIGAMCKKLEDIENVDNYKIIKYNGLQYIPLYNDEKEMIKNNDVIFDNIIINKNNDVLCYITHNTEIYKKHANEYLKLVEDDILKVYNEANINKPLIFDKNKKNIAIHIRVWNDWDAVCDKYEEYINSSILKHALNENQYHHIISKLINKFPDYDIHIFSQPSFITKYPNIYNNKNLNFHFDMDALDSMHHLINADVLVLGYSTFSFLAGIYNKNTVIYTYYPYIHKLMDRWINFNEI